MNIPSPDGSLRYAVQVPSLEALTDDVVRRGLEVPFFARSLRRRRLLARRTEPVITKYTLDEAGNFSEVATINFPSAGVEQARNNYIISPEKGYLYENQRPSPTGSQTPRSTGSLPRLDSVPF